MTNTQKTPKIQVNNESLTKVLLLCVNSLTSDSKKLTNIWEFAETFIIKQSVMYTSFSKICSFIVVLSTENVLSPNETKLETTKRKLSDNNM